MNLLCNSSIAKILCLPIIVVLTAIGRPVICQTSTSLTSMLSSLFAFEEEANSLYIEDLDIRVDIHEVSIKQFKHFKEVKKYIPTFDKQKGGYSYSYQDNRWLFTRSIDTWEVLMSDYNENLPAFLVSYEDACHYCTSKGGRLPTAAEWEYYSGETIVKGNIWHGIFPYRDYGNDGYKKTLSPIGKMKPLDNGLHDIYGNVWELVASADSIITAKGGSYLCDFSMCSDTRKKGNLRIKKDRIQENLGFRCVYPK